MRHFAYRVEQQNGAGYLLRETISSKQGLLSYLENPLFFVNQTFITEKMNRTFNILLVVGCLTAGAPSLEEFMHHG